MGILFDESTKTLHLKAGGAADYAVSYVLQLHPSGHPAHLYWGSAVRHLRPERVLPRRYRSFSPSPRRDNPEYSPDHLPQEYPAFGAGDFRAPAFEVRHEDGSSVSALAYVSHRIVPGKLPLTGLPATYVEDDGEADTLEITLEDPLTSLAAVLSYTAFRDFPAVARSARFINRGAGPVTLARTLSAVVDLPHDRFDLIHLSGAWARERHAERRPLGSGMTSLESRRGASSHQANPFFALVSKDATEHRGGVYAFSLVYSGNFLAFAEVDQFRTARAGIGLNPFDFSWLLAQGEEFTTPEAVLVYSDRGLNGMSQAFHGLYRTRLARGTHRDAERPILVNNWEATYFSFTEEKITDLARSAAALGMELLVLDDGWFGRRNDDRGSLGDWFVNREKLPGGLEALAQRVRQEGLLFGLWFEPEMVSEDSDLYRAHPDWCLHVAGRGRTESRNQLVLDFSRADVCDAVTAMVAGILSSAPISYVKWDFNRHLTEVGSALLPPERQRETAHRYVLGLYRVMDELTSRFPDVLFESCSGGGGRFDPGMLHYMPQVWTSDNTDAVERLKIQYGTSLVYPVSSMGAHVSAVPNHQVHRMTPMEMRGHVAMSGNLGYELDLTLLGEGDKGSVAEQVAAYKGVRPLVQFGKFFRLLSPFERNTAAWMFVAPDGSEALAAYFRVLAGVNEPLERLTLAGLDAGSDYTIDGLDGVYGGDELMNVGLAIPYLSGDFRALVFHLLRTEMSRVPRST